MIPSVNHMLLHKRPLGITRELWEMVLSEVFCYFGLNAGGWQVQKSNGLFLKTSLGLLSLLMSTPLLVYTLT